MKTFLVLTATILFSLIPAHAAQSATTLHIVSFSFDGLLYRAEVAATDKGAHFLLNGVSVHSFALEVGKDYPAKLDRRHGRESFQIMTPDGKGHWMEIIGTAEKQ
jgi:hypothetical protein